jgi:hypothetical protein
MVYRFYNAMLAAGTAGEMIILIQKIYVSNNFEMLKRITVAIYMRTPEPAPPGF